MEGLEKAREVGLDSRVSNAQLELGEAELLEGNLTAARAAFSESLRLRAGTAGARTAFVRVRLARAALEGGDAAAALEMARAAVAEAPGSTDAHQALAEALAASSDPGAKPEFDVADGLSRKGTSFRDVLEGDLWRGRCLARLGLSTDARRALTRAEKAAAEHGFAAAALEARQRLARLGRAP
jgi:tetratricopeptide (TPR) repeat protein